MAHKKSLEALDRTLKDLRDNQNFFGGIMILLSGDIRQTLPVIPRSTVADELNACLKSSNLWQYVKTLHLTTNIYARERGKILLRFGAGAGTVTSLFRPAGTAAAALVKASARRDLEGVRTRGYARVYLPPPAPPAPRRPPRARRRRRPVAHELIIIFYTMLQRQPLTELSHF
ncbi:hypothetical protein EVAR_23078_1 [Eumeta japonica]|uniref:ATP-dependent DNA helicase n=1 Tax=Eumeta variegata TaxID=151549 RepID=A0A4C1VMY0_EUMVA|nr:hypothetical protein EVAR_23078_1 [Eumeta japonica]